MNITRRAASDVVAVCQHSTVSSAMRWLASLTVHASECVRTRSLSPADRGWRGSGARFRTPSGAVVYLPGSHTDGAREMYCRNVYLRSGLVMPTDGWVVDLGANRGLFSVWAAVTGSSVVAVEAQAGFADEISRLSARNRVEDRVHLTIAVAGGEITSGASVGVVANEQRWHTTSHGAPERPPSLSIPQLMEQHQIDRIGLLKMDIEGGEFAVLAADEDLTWLGQVDQITLEVHRDFGNVPALIDRLKEHGFAVELRDNNGSLLASASDRVEYAYCRRLPHAS